MTSDEDAATVRAFYASFDDRPYEETIAPFLHEDVVWHVAGSNPLAGTFRGIPEVLTAMRSYAEASAETLRLGTQTVLAGAGHVVAIHAATAAVAGFDYRRTRSTSSIYATGALPPSGHSPKIKRPRISSGQLLDDAGLDLPGRQ